MKTCPVLNSFFVKFGNILKSQSVSYANGNLQHTENGNDPKRLEIGHFFLLKSTLYYRSTVTTEILFLLPPIGQSKKPYTRIKNLDGVTDKHQPTSHRKVQ